jgi:diguanylate cyclase (GGDEF)-like protein
LALYFALFLAWLAFAITAIWFAVATSIQAAESALTRHANSLYERIYNRMQSNEAVLDGFAALLGATGRIDDAVARRYANKVLQRYPHIFALEIVQPVDRADLSSFVRAQRQQWPNFDVRTFAYLTSRKWEPPPPKPTYYPIVFMEPLRPGSEEVLGLDVDSVPFLRSPMAEALHSRNPVASAPFRLVEGDLAYLMFRPISTGAPPRTRAGELFPNYTVLLVVDARRLAEADPIPFGKHTSLYLYHHDFAAADPAGSLAHLNGTPGDRLSQLLFPRFYVTRAIETPSQPFVLMLKKQVVWADLNRPLLSAIAASVVFSFIVLAGFIRAHHRSTLDQLAAEQRLIHLATHDPLTGLPNRTLLLDRIEQAIARAQRRQGRFAVLFIDINGFKQINDRYGHDAGDKLLKILANRFRTCIRNEDTAARYSGDEFIVVLEAAGSSADAIALGGKIAAQAALPVTLGAHEVAVSASIGIAHFPEDGATAADLLRHADNRMYADKHGRA